MAYQSMRERNVDGPSRFPLAELTTAEQFVLGTCRCWDAFMDDPDPAGLAWREFTPVFAYMNVMGALCAFERTFTVLHRHPAWGLREDSITRTPGSALRDGISSPSQCPAQ